MRERVEGMHGVMARSCKVARKRALWPLADLWSP